MFVTEDDFLRQPFSLNLDGLDAGEFQDFVDYHEEENLRKLLGNLFYDDLANGIKGKPALYKTDNYSVGDRVIYVSGNVADIYQCTVANPDKLPTDTGFWAKQPVDRWVRLQYGDMYLYYGRPQRWYGMARLCVRLIYSLWLKYSYDKVTQGGAVMQQNENSVTISPSVRIARAWNEYCRLCAGDFPNVIDPNYIMWPELENSLFGYLYMNDSTWDDLTINYPAFVSFRAYLAYSFNYPGKTNVFGI